MRRLSKSSFFLPTRFHLMWSFKYHVDVWESSLRCYLRTSLQIVGPQWLGWLLLSLLISTLSWWLTFEVLQYTSVLDVIFNDDFEVMTFFSVVISRIAKPTIFYYLHIFLSLFQMGWPFVLGFGRYSLQYSEIDVLVMYIGSFRNFFLPLPFFPLFGPSNYLLPVSQLFSF